MMPNRSADILFQLIKSLEKSEKRHFKLYIKRSSSRQDLKIIQLFDAIDKGNDYNEKLLLKKLPTIEKPQLANLKSHLYKELLASLRLLKSTESIDLQLHEQLDYARILYNKGLYLQSLKILERVKDLAKAYHQESFLIQVISLEKKIETLHITRSGESAADRLTNEANIVNEQRTMITALSNLALQLYQWYVKNGHARNEKDEKGVREFFKENLKVDPKKITGFYQLLYLYQSYCWYAFIRQDFLMYYRYSKKWVELFKNEPLMITVETGHYIKGMHNVLTANFDLRNYRQFDNYLAIFERFTFSKVANHHDNFRMQAFVYITSAKINQHLMKGSFGEGLKLVPAIEKGLKEFSLYIDRHRVLVIQYKTALLYFGNGNYEASIDHLQKIINGPVDMRIDLQCYARLLHLMAHFELGNDAIIESLIRSVFRFMSRMENFTVVEEEMFKFLRNNVYESAEKLKPGLKKFLSRIKQFEKNRFETRAFSYLDIISWLESKVYEKPMAVIVHDKYLHSRHR
ncbi:MAG TPA: hypothetical protein VK484_02815 [Ferruginibacter sp.]|nr:hypothetical protein [Ferruginibacter sp.]